MKRFPRHLPCVAIQVLVHRGRAAELDQLGVLARTIQGRWSSTASARRTGLPRLMTTVRAGVAPRRQSAAAPPQGGLIFPGFRGVAMGDSVKPGGTQTTASRSNGSSAWTPASCVPTNTPPEHAKGDLPAVSPYRRRTVRRWVAPGAA
jgi:hypothetical protein